MSKHDSPLRYPGGKGKLSTFVQAIFEENDLCDGIYVEPYAGGASVALSLLFLQYASHIHLNDLNRGVFLFWDSVLNRTEELCKLIRDTPVTVDEWKRQREVLRKPQDHSDLEIGFSTFYLNRTNRSGIISGGGVIGGLEQKGEWKIDARYGRDALIERIEKISLYRSRITVHNLDAADMITSVINKLPSKSLVYLDPPFYEKGHGLYESYYKPDDHAKIASLVQSRLNRHWIVSYDNKAPIRKLYQGRRKITFGLAYTAGARYDGSEVMFFSDDLLIPNINSRKSDLFPTSVSVVRCYMNPRSGPGAQV